jgi:glycosyltransferase involved in cell wall biosynthesis
LEVLAQELSRLGHAVEVRGSPERILHNAISDEGRHRLSVELLNGYRALYLRAWRPRKTDLRLFVLHQDIDFNQGKPFRRLIRKLLVRLLVARVDLLIRVCNKSIPDSYASGKIRTIYNGVTLPETPAQPDPDRPFTLIMVGAVNDVKNQLMGLQLLTRLPDVRLLLVGDGPRRAEWQAWAEANGLADRVEWSGFVADPSPYYRRADALLLLSRVEAFPYVMLEAMSFGVPVISVPVGGVHEAITGGQDGILLPSYEIDALESAVRPWLQDRAACRLMGQKARETVRHRFTIRSVVEQFVATVTEAAK